VSEKTIHRLLDEAFTGVDMTGEAQELKEEMRANLMVRIAELEESGLAPDAAARRAMAELGDIRALVSETSASVGPAAPWASQRVRPRPGFVVRTVCLALIAAGAVAAVALAALGTVDLSRGWQLALVAVTAVVGGAITADALRQETTTNYPVPPGRALGYGTAAVLALAGAGCLAVAIRNRPLPLLVGGGLALVAAIVGLTYLGATQTNRHKPWVVRLRAEHTQVGDRFSKDPAAAARFGLYTVAIWLVAAGGFVVLGFTVGWVWSWLALLGGLVLMMLTLARMLFDPTVPNLPRGPRV
jgi:hypothetical protein